MGFKSQDIIIPQPRPPIAAEAHPLKLVPIFDLLRRSRQAVRVANIKDEAEIFSRPVLPGNCDVAMHVVVKAPGTDFYLPADLGQFLRPLQEMSSYQYSEKNKGSPNRTGLEYCSISIYQQNQEPLSSHEPGPYNEHIDMNMIDAINTGGTEYIDRYVLSNRSGTWFYKFNLRMDDVEERKRAAADPGYVGAFIRARGLPARQFDDFDLIHFDNARPHALHNPRQAGARTLLVGSFSCSPIDPGSFCNPALSRAYRRQQALSFNQGYKGPIL
jgi:hypothetical protein